MRTAPSLRPLAAASITVGLLLAPTAALAHPDGSDYWDGTYSLSSVAVEDVPVYTDIADVDIVRMSDNVEFVAHVPVAPTSDMQFQRREGIQYLDGEIIGDDLEDGETLVKDYVFMGGTADPGLSVFDITDPTAPVLLTTVSCGGFHSDVAVYENYLVQVWDGSNVPCAEGEPADPNALDEERGTARGVRIFDITDPARPELVKIHAISHLGIGAGVHNVTINGEAGLAYLNMAELNAAEPRWGYVDLNDPELPLTFLNMRLFAPGAADGCHDQAIAPTRKLLACAGINITHLWSIEDPRNPTLVAQIPNPAISIHHGSRFTPDENTLVLGDELVGAANPTPCQGQGNTNVPVGAAWFYDITVPQAPVLNGVFSTPDTDGDYCTTHFYGFQDGTTLMPMGMYDAGIEVVDYAPVADGLPGSPTEHAFFEPNDMGFFSAYAYRGYVYGSAFEYGAPGRNKQHAGRGLWIIEVEGLTDDTVAPSAVDEGNSWGRWTPETSAPAITMAARIGLADAESHTNAPLYAIGLGVVLLLVEARRRRTA